MRGAVYIMHKMLCFSKNFFTMGGGETAFFTQPGAFHGNLFFSTSKAQNRMPKTREFSIRARPLRIKGFEYFPVKMIGNVGDAGGFRWQHDRRAGLYSRPFVRGAKAVGRRGALSAAMTRSKLRTASAHGKMGGDRAQPFSLEAPRRLRPQRSGREYNPALQEEALA